MHALIAIGKGVLIAAALFAALWVSGAWRSRPPSGGEGE